jgi:hypothetical protein
VWKEVELLKYHPDFTADFSDVFQVVGQLDPIDQNFPGLMFLEPVDATDHGGLARPGRAADDDTFSLLYLQMDAFQCVKVAVPFMHIDQFNDLIP